MVPLDDGDRVADADEIVRGTLTDVRSQWNDDHTNIVTTAQVAVKNRVKGHGPDTLTIEVLGGSADGVTEWVEDEPVFVQGLEAYLFVRKNPPSRVQAHGRVQGVVPVSNGKVPGNSLKKGAGIPVADYDTYLLRLAKGETVARPAGVEPLGPSPRVVTAGTPVISSVEPSTGSAGTATTITITGTGFGTKASRGSYADVGFLYTYYDDGSWDPIWASGFIVYDDYGNPMFQDNANEIVSWSDTRIVVRVPTGSVYDSGRMSLYSGSAGSGPVIVLTDDGAESGPKPFTVTFGNGKQKWDSPAQYHVNPGSLGSEALAQINAAATSWNTAANAGSMFRFNYAGQSSSTTFGQDGTSLICFGPASHFSSSAIIGHARVFLQEGTSEITEADVEFNSGFSWTTGTASGDLMNVEHIALHELGHWLQLRDLYGCAPGYPSDTDKTMFGMTDDYFGNMNGKTLHADDIAGIRWIYPVSSMSVTSITPDSGAQGTTVTITDLAGTGFGAIATVKLARSGCPDIPATNVVVTTPTMITCQFALPADATPGDWDVVVANEGGPSGTLSGGFTLTPTPDTMPPATVTGLTDVHRNATSITWIWTDPADEDFTSVRVYQNGIVKGNVAKGIQTYTMTDLAPNTVYTLSTCTYDLAGNANATFVNSSASTTGMAVVPDANFVANVTSGRSPLVVRFMDTSTGSPTSWSWNFGDGADAEVQHPEHTYTAAGTYTVVLTVTNTDGSDSELKSGFISVTAPLSVVMIPGGVGVPEDTDRDRLYDDVNGNGRKDFADVVLFFNQMSWIAANEPVECFDYNGNARIDFADVVWLFNQL